MCGIKLAGYLAALAVVALPVLAILGFRKLGNALADRVGPALAGVILAVPVAAGLALIFGGR